MTRFKALYLLFGEESPATSFEVLLRQTCIIYAVEFLNRVTQVLEYAAHDAVATRVNLDANLLLVLLYVGYFVGVYLAIVESDTLGNLIHVGTSESLIQCHLINLLLHERRVGELAREVSIVGKEEQSDTILVETTNGVDALGAGALDQLHYGLVGVGVFE